MKKIKANIILNSLLGGKAAADVLGFLMSSVKAAGEGGKKKQKLRISAHTT